MSVFTDAQMHALARHLVAVDHRADVKKEIHYLNDHYDFVPSEQFSAFERELLTLYEFEKSREIKSLNKVGFARFKLDQLMGDAFLERHDALLNQELAN